MKVRVWAPDEVGDHLQPDAAGKLVYEQVSELTDDVLQGLFPWMAAAVALVASGQAKTIAEARAMAEGADAVPPAVASQKKPTGSTKPSEPAGPAASTLD